MREKWKNRSFTTLNALNLIVLILHRLAEHLHSGTRTRYQWQDNSYGKDIINSLKNTTFISPRTHNRIHRTILTNKLKQTISINFGFLR